VVYNSDWEISISFPETASLYFQGFIIAGSLANNRVQRTPNSGRRWPWACVPCMWSCLGVKVPCPGIRGAEGQGKRKGVTVRWGLKEAWNEGAGRGTRTGYEVWYARGELARNSKALHPQGACFINPASMHRRYDRLPREICGVSWTGLRAEQSSLTASQKSADGIVPPVRVGRPER